VFDGRQTTRTWLIRFHFPSRITNNSIGTSTTGPRSRSADQRRHHAHDLAPSRTTPSTHHAHELAQPISTATTPPAALALASTVLDPVAAASRGHRGPRTIKTRCPGSGVHRPQPCGRGISRTRRHIKASCPWLRCPHAILALVAAPTRGHRSPSRPTIAGRTSSPALEENCQRAT
jgi:hypothetical protein